MTEILVRDVVVFDDFWCGNGVEFISIPNDLDTGKTYKEYRNWLKEQKSIIEKRGRVLGDTPLAYTEYLIKFHGAVERSPEIIYGRQ